MNKKFLFGVLVLFCFVFMPSVSADWNNDAILYLSLDNDTISGSNTDNLANLSNYGIINGGLTTGVKGKINDSFSGYSASNFLTVLNSNELQFQRDAPFTISMWVNRTASTTADHTLISYHDADSPYAGWRVNLNSAGALNVEMVSSFPNFWVNRRSSTSPFPSANVWYHLVVTYNGNSDSSGFSVYVNGASFSMPNVDKNTLSSSISYSGSVFNVGLRDSSISPFNIGRMDEIGVWNRVLNSSEIAELYNNGTGFNPFNVPPPPVPPSDFVFTAKDVFANGSVQNFSVSLDNIYNFSTTNGSITLNTTIYNGTFDVSYFGDFFTSDNVTLNISGGNSYEENLTLGSVKFNFEDLFNNPLTGVNYQLTNSTFTSAVYSADVWNPVLNGVYNLTTFRDDYYNVTEQTTINGGSYPFNLSMPLYGLTDNRFTLQVKSIVDNSTITNYTGTLYQYTEGYTEIFSTTNGSFTFELMQGYEYFIELNDVEGYANNFNNNYTFTPNNMSGSHILYLYTDNSIRFFIYDENNNSLITENITIIISGDPYEQTLYTSNGTLFVENIPDGTYNIKLFNANYTERTYLTTVSNKSTQELNAYLTQEQNSVTFTTLDGSSSTALGGVAITMYRVINNTWISVESKLTDITGRAVFNYVTNTNYRFIASRTGYQDKIFNLDPIIFEFYNVRLDKEYITDVQLDYSNIYISYNPKRFFNDAENNLSYMIQSPEGKLSSYYLNVSYPGGYQYFTGSNSIGEQFFIQFNITGATINDQVKLDYGYTSVLGDNKTFTDVFRIERSPSSMSWSKKVDRTYGLGAFELSLISVFFALLISGIGVMIGGGIVGGLLGLLTLAFFTFLGFIPLWSILISVFVGFMVILGRSR